jgi:hypothetical protein
MHHGINQRHFMENLPETHGIVELIGWAEDGRGKRRDYIKALLDSFLRLPPSHRDVTKDFREDF